MLGYRIYELMLMFAVYAMVGRGLENLFWTALAGGEGRRGIVRGPFGVLTGLGGVLGAAVLMPQIQSPYVQLAAFAAGAIVLDLVGMGIVRVLSGQDFWKFNGLAAIGAGIAGFAVVEALQPFVLLLAAKLPPVILWAVLLAFWIPCWGQTVEAAARLLAVKKGKDPLPAWKQAYPNAGL